MQNREQHSIENKVFEFMKNNNTNNFLSSTMILITSENV